MFVVTDMPLLVDSCRLVKAELLPFAYWNFMTKGFVPWGEYKRAREAFLAKLAGAKQLGMGKAA